jgi:hypothetical protein
MSADSGPMTEFKLKSLIRLITSASAFAPKKSPARIRRAECVCEMDPDRDNGPVAGFFGEDAPFAEAEGSLSRGLRISSHESVRRLPSASSHHSTFEHFVLPTKLRNCFPPYPNFPKADQDGFNCQDITSRSPKSSINSPSRSQTCQTQQGIPTVRKLQLLSLCNLLTGFQCQTSIRHFTKTQ